MTTEYLSDSSSFKENEIAKGNDVESFQQSVLSSDESPDSVNNPFLNETFREKYANLYEESKYECRAKFDPYFKWTKQQQRKLTWKLDLRVTLIACLFFSALQLDRELPSQLISKRLGSDVWIPIQITAWSIVTICQFRLDGKGSFYACRALLGFFEGGFIPDLVLWLSYFYTSAELSIRLSFFWTAMYATTIVNYLIAYGILHMRGVHGHAGWAWLFLIEGFITLAIGISAFFLMVPSAVQTQRPWNKNGWLNEEEQKIVVNKILRDDPSKGDMHNRQGLTLKMLFQALCDWHLWPIYLIGICAYIPENTITAYLTLVLKDMGFSTFHTNLLCIPYNFLKIIVLIAVTYFSERVTNIFGTALIQPLWVVPLVGVLRFWKGSLVNHWGTYVVLTIMLADPYIHAMMVSACSRNSQSIKTRTVSASLYNMFVQAGSIISSNIYRTPDKPLYHTGNSILFAFGLAMFPILIGTKLFYMYLNKRRDKIWNAMSDEERENYLKTTTDSGSSRLDFRFAH